MHGLDEWSLLILGVNQLLMLYLIWCTRWRSEATVRLPPAEWERRVREASAKWARVSENVGWPAQPKGERR